MPRASNGNSVSPISLCGVASSVRAGDPATVAYSDTFEAYGTQANPPGWVDSAVGRPAPNAQGLYKTWKDPLTGNANVVYGTKQASGKPEGNNPRIGTFSTYSLAQFSAADGFEYRGRFIRTDSDSRIGLTFFSAYPERDDYYLLDGGQTVHAGRMADLARDETLKQRYLGI